MRPTLPRLWVRAWERDGDRVVLLDADRRTTAAELAERTAAAARRLAAVGVAPGQRVLLSAAPSVDLVV
ncbi:MAG: hypothetical protein MUC45_08680, partial [Actinomycetia bacterium]|nr:hypothetical protein [Actinomycetes bacterium]